MQDFPRLGCLSGESKENRAEMWVLNLSRRGLTYMHEEKIQTIWKESLGEKWKRDY